MTLSGARHAHANVHINANAAIQPCQSTASNIMQSFHNASYTYSTTAATAAKAPAAPIPIAGPICIAAPLAFVEALVVLPVFVCVPPVELPVEPVVVDPSFAAPAEPPLTAPVVDAEVDVGADAVLVTEPAVITTGRKETSVPDRVVAVEAGKLNSVAIAPSAPAVHTAIELPERTQLMDMVLRGSQSRTWPDTGT